MLQFLPPPTPSPGPENAPAAFLGAPRGILEGIEDWDTSCLDWEARLLDGRSLVPDLPLYEAEAAKALRVFKRLRLPGRDRDADAGGCLWPLVFSDRGRAVWKLRSGQQYQTHLGNISVNP